MFNQTISDIHKNSVQLIGEVSKVEHFCVFFTLKKTVIFHPFDLRQK